MKILFVKFKDGKSPKFRAKSLERMKNGIEICKRENKTMLVDATQIEKLWVEEDIDDVMEVTI